MQAWVFNSSEHSEKQYARQGKQATRGEATLVGVRAEAVTQCYKVKGGNELEQAWRISQKPAS